MPDRFAEPRDPAFAPRRQISSKFDRMLSLTTDERRERRWIILGEDGRYVTLGRASDPSREELEAAEHALRAQGTGGWVAVMEGNPYVGGPPHVMEVRALADPKVAFAEAAQACLARIGAMRRDLEGG